MSLIARRIPVALVLAAALVGVLRVAPPAQAFGNYVATTTGYDISWPQCGGAYPASPYGFGIVGITDGRAYTQNPCLASEYQWATHGTASAPSVYMNLNYGTALGSCAHNDKACQAYTYGRGAAQYAVTYATAQSVAVTTWWLDIETGNSWSKDAGLNDQVIQGATGFLRAQGLVVGVYSTPYQWGAIAGSFSPGLPNWTAGASSSDPASYCASAHAFGGGTVWLAQYASGSYDGDYAC
ncbi:MAG: hypothetical protein PVSMB4_08000 [Ktedonobacterales bacterium]